MEEEQKCDVQGEGLEKLWLSWVEGTSNAFNGAMSGAAGGEVEDQPVRISRKHTIAPGDLSFMRSLVSVRNEERPTSTPGGSKVTPLKSRIFSSARAALGGSPVPEANPADFMAHLSEVTSRAGGQKLEERDSDAVISKFDKAEYLLENYVASDGTALLKLLLLFTGTTMFIFGTIWTIEHNMGDKDPASHALDGWLDKIFFTFQILATGGYDDSFGDHMDGWLWVAVDRVNFTGMLMTGLVVFAVLVGVITTAFEARLDGIAEGRTKVAEERHTLILGWNESTVRVVCQIAFLRRQWRMQNETTMRRLFPFLRTKPTTPVAKYPVVILCNRPDTTKADIDEVLNAALAARGISPKRTKVGWDVIVRIGDPTVVHDLIRVNAHKASSIMVMMSHNDAEEYEASGRRLKNGATVRTLLGLRSILCVSAESMKEMDNRDMRIVIEMQEEADFVDSACFKSPLGRRLNERMDLTVYINSLMFLCASKPNMSQVVMTIMDFKMTTFRLRAVAQTRGGAQNKLGALIGMTFTDACHHCCFKRTVLVGVTNTKVLTEKSDGTLDLRGDAGELIGICPEPDYVLREDDYFIFVSPTSNPMVMPKKEFNKTLKDAGVDPEGGDAVTPGAQLSLHAGHAKELHSARIPTSLISMSEVDEKLKVGQKLMVCGWRKEWTADPNRFQARLADVAKGAKPGSFVCCYNTFQLADFEEKLLNTAGGTRQPAAVRLDLDKEKLLPGTDMGWTLVAYPDVKIYHVTGDSASKKDIMPFLEANKNGIRTVIVMGTMATTELTPQSMDTRVLMILLLVRHITKNWEHPVHTITENQLDQTADLAALPGGADEDPDFINTRAIAARGLTMAMAYPRMQPAVREIFFGSSPEKEMVTGRPQFDLIPPSLVGLVKSFNMRIESEDGDSTEGALSFGAVQLAVSKRFGGWAYAIGIRSTATKGVKLAPGINFMHVYTDADSIVIIRRKFYASTQVEMGVNE